jgi:formiminotetrahydrofolate cyclodeaminase
VSSARGYLALQLEDFLDEVASADLLPGAGFVAAVGVAMSAGLVAMTARLSHEHWPEARAVAAQAESLRRRVTPLAELNAEAYGAAVATLRGEGSAPAAGRDEEIARALDRAARVPLAICETAGDVVALAADVVERGEQSLRADAAVAALVSHACARGAAALVEVNLATQPGDDRLSQARACLGAASLALDRALAPAA